MAFFFSMWLVRAMYIPARTMISRMPIAHIVLRLRAAASTRAAMAALYSSSFNCRFAYISACSSSCLCRCLSSSFSFLRWTLSICLLFYASASPSLFLALFSLIEATVCPFLFLSSRSMPRAVPAVYILCEMVCKSLMTASWRAVLPSLFCAFTKNCFSNGVSRTSF